MAQEKTQFPGVSATREACWGHCRDDYQSFLCVVNSRSVRGTGGGVPPLNLTRGHESCYNSLHGLAAYHVDDFKALSKNSFPVAGCVVSGTAEQKAHTIGYGTDNRTPRLGTQTSKTGKFFAENLLSTWPTGASHVFPRPGMEIILLEGFLRNRRKICAHGASQTMLGQTSRPVPHDGTIYYSI